MMRSDDVTRDMYIGECHSFIAVSPFQNLDHRQSADSQATQAYAFSKIGFLGREFSLRFPR